MDVPETRCRYTRNLCVTSFSNPTGDTYEHLLMCSQYNMFEVYMPRNRAVVLRWPRAKHGPDQQLGSMVAEDAVYNGS